MFHRISRGVIDDLLLIVKQSDINTNQAILSQQPSQAAVSVPAGGLHDVHANDNIENLQSIFIQRKLTIGTADDPMEREADAMAGNVMQIPEKNFVQRCACEEEERVQRKPSSSFIQTRSTETIADANVSDQINASRGNGQSMDSCTINFMQTRFGADFSNVNIHTGSEATAMSRELSAKAFTVGNDIYFNEGQYQPGSNSGKHLLAHELAHTLQQSNNVARKIQKREMAFNPALIAIQLRDAMKGWGTDEAAIYAALSGRTPEQVNLISVEYKKLTGRDLEADLKDELTDSELKKLALYGQVLSDTPEDRAIAVAIQLRDAMEGWGTDENAIYVALQSRSESDLSLIRAAYLNLTGHDLMADLRDELNDEEYNKATGTMGMAPNVVIKNTELGMLFVGNFDFNFTNCNINVEVRLKFQFTDDITAAEQNGFRSRFLNAVQSKWQHGGFKLVGGTSCPCEEIPITINVIENPSNYHKIVDVERKVDDDRRPFVASDINVNFYSDDDTLMHEFGHVLGLYDEYIEQQELLPIPVLGPLIKWVGESFATAMWHRNNPKDKGSLMNQTGLELRPRFFEHYGRAANETAPIGCDYKVSN